MSFQEKYSEIFGVVTDEIEQVKQELLSGIELEKPLKSKLLEILNAPSKHIRAVVAFLVLKAFGCKITQQQIILQAAIELVHNASLIHDDIIDESQNRRGVETLNSLFETKLAVIAGDYLISLALKKIRALGSFEIIDMFAQTLDDMCQGEVSQQFSKFKIPTIEEYLKKTQQKTAKLFETAICGSLSLVSTESLLSHKGRGKNFLENVSEPRNSGEGYDFSEFAKAFGIAFQIRDDLINAKTSKSDFKDGIYTAPVILAGSVEGFENGIEKTKDLLNNYIECAENEIEKLKDSKYKTALIELLGLIRDE